MAKAASSPKTADGSQVALFDRMPVQALGPSPATAWNDADELPAPPGSSGKLLKPVETIVLQPRTGKLTLLDRRFFNVLLRHAQENPIPDGAYFRISLSQFMADAKYESRNMEHLTDVLNHMMGTVVNWGDSASNLKGPSYQWQGAPLIAFARIRKSPNRPPVLEYEFQRELLPQLLNPKVYTTISLELIAKMKTYAATVLLEIGFRYLGSPTGLTKRLPWREWVVILTGNSESKTELKYFIRDSVRPAIAQVNAAQDDFEITLLAGKVNRRIETLQFHIKRLQRSTPDQSSRLAEVGVDNLELVGRLRKLKVPQATAETLILQHGPRRMRAALAELEPRVEAGKVNAPLGYLKTLLSKGVLDEGAQHVEEVTAKEVPAKPVKEQTRLALRRAYQDAAKRQAMALFEELPREEQEAQILDFEQQRLPELSAPLQRAWKTYRPSWPAKPITAFLRPIFCDWLTRADPEPSDDELLNWAASTGRLVLQD